MKKEKFLDPSVMSRLLHCLCCSLSQDRTDGLGYFLGITASSNRTWQGRPRICFVRLEGSAEICGSINRLARLMPGLS